MKFWIWALFLLFCQGRVLTLLFKKFHRSIVGGFKYLLIERQLFLVYLTRSEREIFILLVLPRTEILNISIILFINILLIKKW
jgi:hypothetical protein